VKKDIIRFFKPNISTLRPFIISSCHSHYVPQMFLKMCRTLLWFGSKMFGAGGVGHVVELLSCKCEALSSKPSTTHTQTKKILKCPSKGQSKSILVYRVQMAL
jgi:hypothetical protein